MPTAKPKFIWATIDTFFMNLKCLYFYFVPTGVWHSLIN